MKVRGRELVRLAVRIAVPGILLAGLLPFLCLLAGVPGDVSMSGFFFAACAFIGVLTGLVNVILSRIAVEKKLRNLTGQLAAKHANIVEAASNGEIGKYKPEQFHIQADADDSNDKNAAVFNDSMDSLFQSLKLQDALSAYMESISNQQELNAIALNALLLVSKYASANAGAILLKKEGELEIVASYGINGPDSLKSNQIIMDALNSGKQYSMHFPEDIVFDSILTNFHPKDVIVEPVRSKDMPIAALLLASSEGFHAGLGKNLSLFSRSLAIALAGAMEHEHLLRLGALDPLTGILNKRYGLIRLHEEFARSTRSEMPLGIIIYNIDHFKELCERFGHIAGDAVIKTVTQQVGRSLREGDIFVRYSGDEFLLVLPGASKNDTAAIAERLRLIVRDGKTIHGEYSFSVTISVGCDSYPETAAAQDKELIGNAQEALYRARTLGNDKSVIWLAPSSDKK